MNNFITLTVLVIIALILALVYENSACAGVLPDVPGVINPNVTQANIKQTICVAGWTSTIRPSVIITNKIKRALMHKNGLDGQDPHKWELDHDISLELGGHPSDLDNLWLQSWTGSCNAHQKDVVETKLKTLVCKNTITLVEAQSAITTDWITAYSKYVNPKGCQ